MKTLAERKASIYFDANFPAYMKRWKALPPMPIKELEEAIVDHELIQHLNYEQSGEEATSESSAWSTSTPYQKTGKTSFEEG